MKSSIVFKGGEGKGYLRNFRTMKEWSFMFQLLSEVALAKKEEIQLTIQHNLRLDELAIMVELPHQTIASHHGNPNTAVIRISNALLNHLRQFRELQAEQKKKRASRKKSGGSHRRPRSTR